MGLWKDINSGKRYHKLTVHLSSSVKKLCYNFSFMGVYIKNDSSSTGNRLVTRCELVGSEGSFTEGRLCRTDLLNLESIKLPWQTQDR